MIRGIRLRSLRSLRFKRDTSSASETRLTQSRPLLAIDARDQFFPRSIRKWSLRSSTSSASLYKGPLSKAPVSNWRAPCALRHACGKPTLGAGNRGYYTMFDDEPRANKTQTPISKACSPHAKYGCSCRSAFKNLRQFFLIVAYKFENRGNQETSQGSNQKAYP
jgi:hypothetical protein